MGLLKKWFSKDKNQPKDEDVRQVQNETQETMDEPSYEGDEQELAKQNERAEEIEEEQEVEKVLEEIEETEEIQEEDQIEKEHQEILESDQPEFAAQKKGFFSKLVKGLAKTRNNIMSGVDQVLKSFTKIDEELYEELEEALIMADIGVQTTLNIMNNLRNKVKENKITDASELKQLLIQEISSLLEQGDHEIHLEEGPTVILVIGVNGVGKTTTIGKLAHNIKMKKKKVLLAAADTFRAAAIDQLEVWGSRAGVDVIRHQENSDPAAVVFDAVQAAKARRIDALICDTAGRLHNKKNLMEELKKIFKIISREYPEAKKEVLLVLDATTGQNAVQQVKLFKEVADISGIVLTKLDGTAKGGIIIAINSEMNIPVKYIGVGEGIDDLQPFNPTEFAKALFEEIDDEL